MDTTPRLRDIVLIPLGFWVILLILKFTGVITSQVTTLGTAAILALVMAVKILPSQTMRVIAGMLIFATIAYVAVPWILSFYFPYARKGMEERGVAIDILRGEQIGGEVNSIALLLKNCRKEEDIILKASLDKFEINLQILKEKPAVDLRKFKEFNAKLLVDLKEFNAKQLVDLKKFKKKPIATHEQFNEFSAKQLVDLKEFEKSIEEKKLANLKEFNTKQLVDLGEFKEHVKSFDLAQKMRQTCSEHLKEKANLNLSGSQEDNQTFHAIIWKTIGFAILWLCLFGGFMRTGALRNMGRETKITFILISLVVAAALSAWLIFDEGALATYTFLKTEVVAKSGRELFWVISGIIGFAIIIKDWGQKSIGIILIKITIFFAVMIAIDQVIWTRATTGIFKEIQRALPWLRYE